MMRTTLTALLICGLPAFLAGCTKPKSPPATASNTTADAAATETAGTPEPTEPAKSEPAEKDSAPATSNKSKKVMLGDPSLTAGIPGDGELTVDRIQAWLDDPANHEVLEFTLPMGLDVGARQVVGVDKNPLTRAKIELGRQLYFDPRLSADASVSCASCHDPAEGYARQTQFGIGIEGQEGGRNSPPAYNRILSGPQFWDGRAESLEAQAIGPIANPIEMGNTHEACVAKLASIEGYKLQFDKIFGELTIEAVGKAIATFERAIVTGPSPYDWNEKLRPFAQLDLEELEEDDPDTFAAYQKIAAGAKKQPMSESAKRGREIFFGTKGACTACHVGPNLSDEKYHNLGVGMAADKPDLGRFEVTKEDKDRGAFKTPTVRNVALTAPYMHDGSQETLMEVVEWYVKGGHPNDHLSDKIKPLKLDDQDKKDLVAFMEACTGDFPKVETGRLPQ